MDGLIQQLAATVPGLLIVAWLMWHFLGHLDKSERRREDTLRAAHATMQQIVQQVEQTMSRVDAESCRREEQTSAVISKCADAMTRMSVLMEHWEVRDTSASRKTAG